MTRQSGPTFFSFPADALAGVSEAAAVVAGLTAESSWVSPKYLYGPLGSRLFDAITELHEYYPTRTERSVLEACRDGIARAAGLAVNDNLMLLAGAVPAAVLALLIQGGFDLVERRADPLRKK